ncbi:MAG TPA: GntR family transcriptional regulator [Streptomyces sp.]|nr:GntR family transcriptional regulator [Streptomyces sp.]
MTGKAGQVADAIRAAIEAGEYPPGSSLPSGEDLAEQYAAHRGTVYKALRQLAAEGYLTLVRRHPAVVRERPKQVMVVRDRNVYRDELGYYFDQNAKDWRAVEKPTRGSAVPPDHVADMLGVDRGRMVFARNRLMGPPGATRALQIATSYIPLPLTLEIPALEAERPGPGGIYDVVEDHFDAPLQWREMISARRPTAEEQRALGISADVPVLVVTRCSMIHREGTNVPVEVNETRMASAQFAVSYAVQRDASAPWPREEREVT